MEPHFGHGHVPAGLRAPRDRAPGRAPLLSMPDPLPMVHPPDPRPLAQVFDFAAEKAKRPERDDWWEPGPAHCALVLSFHFDGDRRVYDLDTCKRVPHEREQMMADCLAGIRRRRAMGLPG